MSPGLDEIKNSNMTTSSEHIETAAQISVAETPPPLTTIAHDSSEWYPSGMPKGLSIDEIKSMSRPDNVPETTWLDIIKNRYSYQIETMLSNNKGTRRLEVALTKIGSDERPEGMSINEWRKQFREAIHRADKLVKIMPHDLLTPATQAEQTDLDTYLTNWEKVCTRLTNWESKYNAMIQKGEFNRLFDLFDKASNLGLV